MEYTYKLGRQQWQQQQQQNINKQTSWQAMRCTWYDSYRYRHSWCVYRCTTVLSSTLEKSFIAFTIFRLDRLVGLFFFFLVVSLYGWSSSATVYGVYILLYSGVDWKKIHIDLIQIISFCFSFLFLALLFSVKYNNKKKVFPFFRRKKKRREIKTNCCTFAQLFVSVFDCVCLCAFCVRI